jgi:glycine/serine hydroxymethyltransferase
VETTGFGSGSEHIATSIVASRVETSPLTDNIYRVMFCPGFRVGTPAVTTRGMKEEEMLEISDLLAEALQNRTDESALNRVRDKVRDLTRRFPLPT